MPMNDDDTWCDGPVIIDEAARRLTVPPGAQSGNNYGDLLGLVKDYEALARLRKFLQLAHRCGENDLCNPCFDDAVLMTLEAEGWTIERQTTSQPDGAAR